MSILWAGGEDIDFTAGAAPLVILTNFRSGYARCALRSVGGAWLSGNVFPGGAVTSCWVSMYVGKPGGANTNEWFGGIGKAGTSNCIFVGIDNSNAGKIALYTPSAKLAVESTTSGAAAHRFDIQVINFGASGTVNVYCDGALIITFTGNLVTGGITNLDSVFVNCSNGSDQWCASEFIVADEDTRAFIGLVTMAPTGAGTTDQWTGAYTDVNETTNSDATTVYTNTATQDEQFNVTDVPAGNFGVKAVVVNARVTSPAGSTATKVALGFNSGGSVAVGTSQTATTAWELKQQIFAQNPVTSADWTLASMNALQLNLRSGS